MLFFSDAKFKVYPPDECSNHQPLRIHRNLMRSTTRRVATSSVTIAIISVASITITISVPRLRNRKMRNASDYEYANQPFH